MGHTTHHDTTIQRGMVIHTTRRNAEIRTDDGRTLTLSFSSKVEAVAPGDRVALENRREGTVISSILPRKNCFFRSYRGERKIIASNLDRIFLVSAVVPLFNTHFVDRVLAFCALQAIPVTLVINKIDLDLSASKPLVEIYRSLGAEMLRTSALASSGLTELCAALADPALGIVAMAGISGVGKSSLLNRLIPTAGIKTCRVSHKTGQGRRTTSQAIAYPYPRLPAPDLLIIDLPGVHAFGVTHLSEREVVGAFPEFSRPDASCEFTDCSHLAEPKCAVKDALAKGQIAPSRYQSYLDMIQEIRAAKPY